jgi:hypothetical protein
MALRKNNPFIRRITGMMFIFSVSLNALFAQMLTASNWIHASIDSLLPGSSWGTGGFTLADFDRDGDLDITISRREISGGKVFWYENESGTWKRHDLGTSDKKQLGAAATDINGDGFPDLVVARYWFENPKVLDRFPDSVWIRKAYIGDLDGDRFADIVMPAGWHKNPGQDPDGIWTYQPWPFHTGIVPNLYGISGRSWVADLDSDGDLDIFTGEQEDPSIGMKPATLKEKGFFWENTGNRRKPSFAVRIIQTDNPGWHDVQMGDVDGDGDMDIVSKVWYSDGGHYHADYWENQTGSK